MNIYGLNFFKNEKGERIGGQLQIIKKIFEVNESNRFNIIRQLNNDFKEKVDFFVTCGDIKITFDNNILEQFYNLKLFNKPRLIRDVTYLRIIPKITNLDVNNFPRFTWNTILPDHSNFPYDPSYNRWLDLKRKYNLVIKDYKKQGDNILLLLQIPTDASLNELNFKNDGYLNFLVRTINDIFKYTDRNIILRSHPLIKKNDVISNFLIKHFNNTKKIFLSKNENLEDDLKNIKCVISYNSSSTVEALFNGINVINLSNKQPCFSAASNSLSDIENLSELNRDEFLKKIAFLHWDNAELESNEIKQYLCKLLKMSKPYL